ncbi:hypothetical protein [Solibacillus sp. FSL K6-1523]|uniref:hypothetical protein n=1 Tax=Solibacillus sp. FSL K6-1523 TaxID=2921471 RepID=UPI0030F7C794
MSLIAQHPYIKIERIVTGLEQFEIKHDRIIYLYNNKVVTQYREFPIKIVMDFSYREIANQGGILYLHTLQGVYPYIVQSSPKAFITAYRAYFK